jgi:allantoin racemase
VRIIAINPNSTAAMTDAISAGINQTLTGADECIGVSNEGAPPAIQGFEDGTKAVPGVLRIIRETPADGYVIACFDDTGLEEARLESSRPVIGIGQAAYHIAALLSRRFAVVTTLPVSVPVIEGNIEQLGFAGSCAGVYASGVPVLELERDPVGSLEKVSKVISYIEKNSPDCAIILGCAGMGILKEPLTARHPSLILDPVECAGRLIPALIAAKMR